MAKSNIEGGNRPFALISNPETAPSAPGESLSNSLESISTTIAPPVPEQHTFSRIMVMIF
jgi:hypothetical protein